MKREEKCTQFLMDLISLDLFCGDLNDVAKNILNLKKKARKQAKERNEDFSAFHRFELNVLQDHYGGNGEVTISFRAWRWETPQELKDRTEMAKRADADRRKARRKHEKKLFEKLKKKFNK